MNKELLEALNILEKENNISKDTLLEAIENSLLTTVFSQFFCQIIYSHAFLHSVRALQHIPVDVKGPLHIHYRPLYSSVSRLPLQTHDPR